MKRMVLYLGALALAIPAPLALPSAAHAQFAPSPEAVDECRAFLPSDPTSNLGECVSTVNTYWRSPQHGLVTKVCDAVLEIDPVFFFLTYDSFSECVRDGADALGW